MMIAYRLEFELFVAVLMFMVKVGSRRNIKYKLGSPAFVESLRRLMGRLYPDMVWPEGLFSRRHVELRAQGRQSSGNRRPAHARDQVVAAQTMSGELSVKRPVLSGGHRWNRSLGVRRQALRPLSDETSNGKTTYYHPVLEGS